MVYYSLIDVPFNLRHICWFCGEPSYDLLSFPASSRQVHHIFHQPIELPACKECLSFSSSGVSESIWSYRDKVKHALMNKYAKHLGIGLQWTKEELEEAEFHGAVLEGFGKSAWQMYEIAKARVDYVGWELCVDGSPLEGDESYGFEFNGVRYLSVQACIDHHVKALSLDKLLLETIVELVGSERFAYGLRIAELNRDISNKERNTIIDEIQKQEQDRVDILEESQFENDDVVLPLVSIVMPEATVQPEAIEWAIEHQCADLETLINMEDAFFDAFEYLGGPTAFALFDGLQWYLTARQDPKWREEKDPNDEFWEQ